MKLISRKTTVGSSTVFASSNDTLFTESRRSQRCNNDPNRSFTEEANDDDESVISAPTIELPARR